MKVLTDNDVRQLQDAGRVITVTVQKPGLVKYDPRKCPRCSGWMTLRRYMDGPWHRYCHNCRFIGWEETT